MPLPYRQAIDVGIVAVVVGTARTARSLSTSGAWAAFIVGTTAVVAGESWGIFLLLFFATSSAISHAGKATKDARMAPVVEKGGERDAWQVLANGAVFSVAALGALALPLHVASVWQPLAAGALTAAAADTWATEVGSLHRSLPRSILTGRSVPHGTSGGVTWLGSLAALAASIFLGSVVGLIGWAKSAPLAALGGGLMGTTVDSLLGATLQVRRWCDACNAGTERACHDCGAQTRVTGGAPWLTNDMVNLASTAAGGLIGFMIAQVV